MSSRGPSELDHRTPGPWTRWIRPAAILVFGLGSIAAYAAVSATVNAQPATTPFRGWVAVLQRSVAPQGNQVKLTVLAGLPGAPRSHPNIGYVVTVCGEHLFDGVLVAGGDARLADIRVVAADRPSTTGGGPSQPPSVVDMPDLAVAQAGTVDLGPVQVLRLTYTDIPACVAPLSAIPPLPEFVGAAELESGTAMSPVRRDSGALWWTGPRSSQYWPLVGALPGFASGDLGVFTGVRGLSGQWSRPVPEYVRVEAGGLAARASLDEAQPQPLSTAGLDWEGVAPMQPNARVTDVDAMSAWAAGPRRRRHRARDRRVALRGLALRTRTPERVRRALGRWESAATSARHPGTAERCRLRLDPAGRCRSLLGPVAPTTS